MPRKTSLLNVKSYIKWVTESVDEMLERDGKYKGGLELPPIDVHNLREIGFFGRAILRKHESKKTRKDIYVERKEITK